jgi:3-deoxy-7-phosphoheptulonate synthase
LARAGLAAGADGLLIEAHPDPVNAFSDAPQQLESASFGEFLKELEPWIELAKATRKRA